MKQLLYVLILVLLTPQAFALDIDLVQTNPSPLVAGEYGDITIRFTSDDQDATRRDVTMKIEETPFLTPISESEYKISIIRAGDSITNTFRVYLSENLEEGFIDFPVQITFGSGEQQTKDLRIFVEEADIPPELYIGEISTTPGELLPDTDRNKLFVTLQNLGDKSAELVRAELIVENDAVKPAFSYSFIDNLASVDAGKEGELEFTIDLEENARGEIPARLELRYRAKKSLGSNYDTYEKSIPFNIPVSDAPFLRIVETEYLDSFAIGSTENRARVTIINEGEEDAQEIRVRALPDVSYPFVFELTTEYVASKIPPGETAIVEFTVEVLKDARLGDYPVSVRLESLVGETRYARDETMVLVANPGRERNNNTVGYGIVALVLIAAIVIGYRTWKNSSGKKKRR